MRWHIMSQSASSSSEAPGTDHDGFSVTQRAILAAREAERFAADAKKRQMAGIKVKSKAKGKSTAKAASKFGVSTRAVELVKIVLANGGKQLVELLWIGRVS